MSHRFLFDNQRFGGRRMAGESIAGLVKDLTAQLSAIASEFGARADRLAHGETGDETHDRPTRDEAAAAPDARELAKQLLAQRMARFDHFPAELFHEPAWDMLLALFVAHEERRTLNVKALVGTAHTPVTTSQRWIDHLHKLKLVDRVIDPHDRRRMEVSLSDTGQTAVRAYLRRLGAA